MATTNLKLISNTPDAGKRSGTPRPITTFYFTRGQRRPIRIARSTTPTAAICAVLRRIGLDEPISVAEVIDSRGKLIRVLKVHYGKITISRP